MKKTTPHPLPTPKLQTERTKLGDLDNEGTPPLVRVWRPPTSTGSPSLVDRRFEFSKVVGT